MTRVNFQAVLLGLLLGIAGNALGESAALPRTHSRLAVLEISHILWIVTALAVFIVYFDHPDPWW
jgi:hypothetical protein